MLLTGSGSGSLDAAGAALKTYAGLRATLSIEFWVKYTTTGMGVNVGFFATVPPGSFEVDMVGGTGVTGNITFSDTSTDSLGIATGLNDGNWHHIVLVYDGLVDNTLTLYVDGVAVAVNSETPGLLIAASLSFSGFPASGDNVQLDEVAVYPQALSAARVAAHYAIGFTGFETYTQAILALNPVAYYRFGEPSGTTLTDSSTFAHNGIYNSTGVTLGQPGAIFGDSNTAVKFDGSTGFGSVPDAAQLRLTADATWMCWVNPAVLTGSSRTICAKGVAAAGTTAGPWLWFLNGSGIQTFSMGNGTSSAGSIAGANNITTGTYQQVAVTRAGSVITLYYNGTMDFSNTLATPANVGDSGLPVEIAQRRSSGSFMFNGTEDEMAFFNYAMTAGQIAALYALGINGPPTPPAMPKGGGFKCWGGSDL